MSTTSAISSFSNLSELRGRGGALIETKNANNKSCRSGCISIWINMITSIQQGIFRSCIYLLGTGQRPHPLVASRASIGPSSEVEEHARTTRRMPAKCTVVRRDGPRSRSLLSQLFHHREVSPSGISWVFTTFNPFPWALEATKVRTPDISEPSAPPHQNTHGCTARSKMT